MLGGKDTPIPADCDIVIDDTLIDIKCTGGNKDILEVLQLLGYASLLKSNTEYNMRMNNICIINLLQGECKIYNIENILDDNLVDYLSLLTNKYNPNKKISINNIKNPLFVDQLNDAKKMEKYYSGYKNMSMRQRKNCFTVYDNEWGDMYDDELGDPFDPMNLNNWDGDQQVGFRD